MNRSMQWRVGALVLLSLAVLLGILVATGPLALHSGNRLAIDYGYAGPVKPGAAVRVSGVVVGTVETVELLAGQDEGAGPEVMVRVHTRIEDRAWPVVTDKARFFVTTLGVLGEHYVDVVPAPGGEPLEPGSVVRGTDLARADLLLPRAAALLEVMGGVLEEGRDEALRLMQALSRLLVRVDDLLSDEPSADLVRDIAATMKDAKDVLAALKQGLGSGEELKSTLAQSRALMGRADRLAAELERMDLPGLAESGKGTLSRVDRALDTLEQSPALKPDKQRELLTAFERTFESVDRVARRADVLLGQIERGEGGAGKAFHDEQLVEDLKTVLHELRTNPLRLLLPGSRE